jgi:alkanesulfonate monooxygenase SsuD/methylene tetrahydromethanopterin reductase-like flavin-dependent oxidoreductase (luciferase family)
MQFALSVPYTLDPKQAADLAASAEEAGWNAVLCWDGIQSKDYERTFDPWVSLAAIATATRRIRIGTLITPLPRRRPWKLARETMSLDHLSGGRVTLAVGLGWPPDGGFSRVGEPTSAEVRRGRLEEGLAILDGLWSGEPFSFSGEHYEIDRLQFRPRPLQSPRIPIWVVARWPSTSSVSRAAHWDGIVLEKQAFSFEAPAEWNDAGTIREVRSWLAKQPDVSSDLDIVVEGDTCIGKRPVTPELLRSYSDSGATWFVESIYTSLDVPSAPSMAERVQKGPPALA